MAGEIIFTSVKDQDEDDQLSILTLKTAGDSAVYYPMFKEGRATERTSQGTTLQAELAHADRRGGESPCKIEVHMYNDNPDKIYIDMKYNLVSIGQLSAKITREAKQELIQAFVVAPPLDPPALPKVKIPKGQADQISFAEIPDGAVMVDFHNERDQFHRYFTREVFDQLPRRISPATNRPIAPGDITYYVAELDDTMQAHPVNGGRRRKGRKGRKTYRKRRFHTRRA
jgi:hypothetical protein